MNLTYTNTITVNEVNAIRKSVGFRQIHPEQLKASLDGSQFIIAARKEDIAIGMARLIWDGGSVALIHDILVTPQYHVQEIETEMISRIFDFLHKKIKPGFGIQIDIRVWNNQEPFYENLGFKISTPQQRGVPMHYCLTDQIELTDSMFKQCQFAAK